MWSLIFPADVMVEITPDDDNDLALPIRGLYVGEEGDVRIHDMAGNEITLTGMLGGVFHPVRARRVLESGTDATGLVGVL